jgi:hypothetical protein
MANYGECRYCNAFPPGLWNFVQSFLRSTDINAFQHRHVDQYYINLIRHFLEAQFEWEEGRPAGCVYVKVKDLPREDIYQAVDCLGVSLGWGPKFPVKYISNAYRIYKQYIEGGDKPDQGRVSA